MTELANLTMNLPKLDKSAKQALRESTRDDDIGGGVQFVSFSGKAGTCVFGQDKEEMDSEEHFILIPSLITKGWMCWRNNEVVGRHEWSAFNPSAAIPESALEDHNIKRAQDGWQPTLGIQFVGEDGTQYSYSTGTKSARGAIKRQLIDAWDARGDDEADYPVFTFGMEQFTARGDKNWKPVFEIVEWLTHEEAAARIAAATADDAEQGQLEDTSEYAPEPEEEEPAPAPRRRGSRRNAA